METAAKYSQNATLCKQECQPRGKQNYPFHRRKPTGFGKQHTGSSPRSLKTVIKNLMWNTLSRETQWALESSAGTIGAKHLGYASLLQDDKKRNYFFSAQPFNLSLRPFQMEVMLNVKRSRGSLQSVNLQGAEATVICQTGLITWSLHNSIKKSKCSLSYASGTLQC